mmetsp:Transcript_38194/g.93671  ORF Transcript_38194/g.93671 Transcript_38194/m.93671 type:complete len:266 (+) Transcript_38194:98-895(+)
MAFVGSVSMVAGGQKSEDPVAKRTSRREVMAGAVAAALATAAGVRPALALDSPTTNSVVNSMLGAYGLPNVKDAAGFTLITAQYGATAVEFLAPSAWIVQRNALPLSYDDANVQASAARLVRAGVGGTTEIPEGPASPLTAGDYRRAEGVSFHVLSGFEGKSVKDINPLTVSSLVVPNKTTGSAADAKVVKGSDVFLEDGFKRVIDFKFETLTTSGYYVDRRCRAAFTVQKGKLYALSGTSSVARWKKLEPTWDTVLASFHVANI